MVVKEEGYECWVNYRNQVARADLHAPSLRATVILQIANRISSSKRKWRLGSFEYHIKYNSDTSSYNELKLAWGVSIPYDASLSIDDSRTSQKYAELKLTKEDVQMKKRLVQIDTLR